MKRPVMAGLAVGLGLVAAAAAGEPRAPGDIQFNHDRHYNLLGLDCVQCHDARHSTRAEDRMLPREAFCLGCHNGKVAPGDCALCHRQADAPMSYPLEERELIFSHAAHVQKAGIDCLACHANVAASTAARAGLPAMELCFSCHDGVRQTVECAACHRRPAQAVRQVHPPGWDQDHRIFAALDRPSCEPCHRTDDRCSLCHRGDNLVGKIHPFNWLALHPVEARARVSDCTACHETAGFCVACHRRESVLPVDHHFSDWLARHGDAARFDMESCDACHGGAAPSCYRSGCHGR